MDSNFTPSEPFDRSTPARMPFSIHTLFRNVGIALVLVIGVLWLYRQWATPSAIEPVAVQSPAAVAADNRPAGVTIDELVRLAANADGTLADADGDTFYCGKSAPDTAADMKACRWVSSPKPVVAPSALPKFTVTGHIGNYRITFVDGSQKDCLSIPVTAAHLAGCYEVAK